MDADEIYMQRCIQLAANGLGTTYPNPLVGSVIVYKDRIIGEGWHQQAGMPHAEVNAVNAVKEKSLLSDSTIYVNLEPCSHFGKTPPCSDLIIKHKIPRAVIGTLDPNLIVAGQGIEKLKHAGIDVKIDVLKKECLQLNRRFFTFHQKKRPYIILKWAETQDQFIAPSTNDSRRLPVWITNQYSRQLVHKWRTEEQAVLIGTNTAVADNPQLDARDWIGSISRKNQPVRVVLDRTGKIPPDSYIFNNQLKTIVISSEKIQQDKENLIFEIANFDDSLPSSILNILYRHEIQSVIIEGGRQTLQTFIDAGIWDEARVFKGTSFFGSGTKSPEITKTDSALYHIGKDELIIFLNHD